MTLIENIHDKMPKLISSWKDFTNWFPSKSCNVGLKLNFQIY